MNLTFIRLPQFEHDCRRLRLSDDDVSAVEQVILRDPEKAPLVRGTGGLRKLRFSPQSSSRGKSGGVRVCYAYFRIADRVYLVTAYGKHEKADLSAAEKSFIRSALSAIGQETKGKR